MATPTSAAFNPPTSLVPSPQYIIYYFVISFKFLIINYFYEGDVLANIRINGRKLIGNFDILVVQSNA